MQDAPRVFSNAVSFGKEDDVAEICPHHGEMMRRPPMTERDGQIWAAEDGFVLRQCQDCCMNLIKNAGGNMNQEKALLTVWGGFAHGHWEMLQENFISLGKGEATSDGVEFDEPVSADEFPDYLRDHLEREKA